MNHHKPTPLITEIGRKLCPVCGDASYSRDGIHPQCAVRRSDTLRRSQLPAPPKAPAQPSAVANVSHWRKFCPACRRSLHVKKATCICGHSFDVPTNVATIAPD